MKIYKKLILTKEENNMCFISNEVEIIKFAIVYEMGLQLERENS